MSYVNLIIENERLPIIRDLKVQLRRRWKQ